MLKNIARVQNNIGKDICGRIIYTKKLEIAHVILYFRGLVK